MSEADTRRAVSRAPRSRGESTRADWQGADQHRHRNAQLERARQSAPAQSRVRTAGVHPRREYVTIAWAPPRLSSAAPPNDGAFAGLSQSRRHNINLHQNYCSQGEKKAPPHAQTMRDEYAKRRSSPEHATNNPTKVECSALREHSRQAAFGGPTANAAMNKDEVNFPDNPDASRGGSSHR